MPTPGLKATSVCENSNEVLVWLIAFEMSNTHTYVPKCCLGEYSHKQSFETKSNVSV